MFQHAFVLVAVVATSAVAQLNAYSSSSSSLSSSSTVRSSSSSSSSAASSVTSGPVYVTTTISDCDLDEPETMITVTNGVTVTWCPACDHIPHTTIYTTVYEALCTNSGPWSMTPATYTVTETCDGPEPTWTPGPDHIPDGYTVTVKDCSKCATPGPVTITEPCGCKATSGVPVPTSPASPSSDVPNSPAAPTSSSNRLATPGGNSVKPPYPSNTGASSTSGSCPGPQCKAAVTGAYTGSGNTSRITPYGGADSEGAASFVGAVSLSSLLCVVLGALAFML